MFEGPSGGSRISQTKGALSHYFAKFSRKLHENEDILGQRGRASATEGTRYFQERAHLKRKVGKRYYTGD